MAGFDGSKGIYTSLSPQVQIPQYAHLNFVTYMFSRDSENPNKLALVDGKSSKSFTCSELRDLITRASYGLLELGIKQGDVVMILLPNCLEFPIIFNAVLKIGGVVTATNPQNTEREITRQMQDSKPKMVFTDTLGLSKVRSFNLPVIIVDEPVNDGEFAFSRLLCESPKRPQVRILQSDPAVILYSSGTTGMSKGVVISHGNLIATMAVAEKTPDEMHPSDTNLVLFPMYHVGGLVWLACASVAARSTFILLPKYNLTDLCRCVERYAVNKITTAPPVILDLLKSPETANYRLNSLRVLISAAAPLGKDTVERMLSKFPHLERFIQLYGMTETTTLGSGERCLLGSAGRLKPSLEARVVDLQTKLGLPPNGRGELWLRGPSIMQGYLNNAVATNEAIDEEGWLHTGDLVYFDEQGYLYIVDRLKELIKYKGYQVAPAELEALLLTHPSVIDCAVVPFLDEAAGEVPFAFIVRDPQKNLSSQEIMDFIAGQVAPYKKIRRVAFVKEILKSAAGKILRKELKLIAHSKL